MKKWAGYLPAKKDSPAREEAGLWVKGIKGGGIRERRLFL